MRLTRAASRREPPPANVLDGPKLDESVTDTLVILANY